MRKVYPKQSQTAAPKYGTKNSPVYEQAKKLFEDALASEQYRRWYAEARECSAFYDGQQLSATERQSLTEMGQVPIVVNMLKPRIDNITGQEIRSRTKLKYAARSTSPQEHETADALSELAYYQQGEQSSTHKLSHIGLHSRITGLGWHEFEPIDGRLVERIADPFEFVWDMSDKTHDLSDSQHLMRYRWFTLDDAVEMFPKHKDYLTQLSEKSERSAATAQKGFEEELHAVPEHLDGQGHGLFRGSYFNAQNGRICVVEYLYRERADVYEAITPSGKIVRTFDEEEARKMAKEWRKGVGYNVTRGYCVKACYFSDAVELWKGEFEHQIDMINGSFIYTPFVYGRELNSGVPYGSIRAAIDPQRLYNKKASKLLWLMSSRQIIAEENASDDWDDVMEQASKPDGLLFVKEDKLNSVRFEKHGSEIANHANALQQHKQEIEEALGIYNEALGMQSNAQSGVAIQRRQVATAVTHIKPLDNFREMRLKYGRKLLALMRTVYREQTAFYVMDDEQRAKLVQLNEPIVDKDGKPIKDKKGNAIVKRDVRVGTFDVFVEEIPDYSAQREEVFDNAIRALQVFGQIGMQPSESLLRFAGVPNPKNVIQELTGGLQPQQQQPPTNNSETEAMDTLKQVAQAQE